MKNSEAEHPKGTSLRGIFVPGTKIINIGAGHWLIAFIPVRPHAWGRTGIKAARISG